MAKRKASGSLRQKAKARARSRSSGNDDYWVSPRNDGHWEVQREGTSRASNVYDRQRDAIDRGKQLAKTRRSELIVQNAKGKIRSKDSYGNDPPSRKDTEH